MQIIEQYNPKSIANVQNAFKDILGPLFETMLQGEMNHRWSHIQRKIYQLVGMLYS